jgi:phenylalanyl-tRNA synthetase beta chain
MRAPLSWLAEHLELPVESSHDSFPDVLLELGYEVEERITTGEVSGPVVIGRVSKVEQLTGFSKPIRYCRVETSDDGEERGIICGATNFAEGDLVVVALPGSVLPGDFRISARTAYGKTSDGMICSARELGLSDGHSGILVPPTGLAEAGDDAAEVLDLHDTVVELEITPDRGYALSVRGLARDLSCALDVPFGDPAGLEVPPADADAWPVSLEESAQCQRFVARRVSGVDPTAPTPWWMRRRLMLSGIRSISLAVDVTNYVMLELGQPLHAFDAAQLEGGLVVRRARADEELRTLDDVTRTLDPDDVVICDDTGPVSLAGVMGGASTEIGGQTTDILLEAAIWDPPSIARTARRHKLTSEASRRFERGVDPLLPPAALERAIGLLRSLGDGQVERGQSDEGTPILPAPVTMDMNLPDRVAGVGYSRGVTVARLTKLGCGIEVATGEQGQPVLVATPPSWRADLERPADLVEEVLRLEGYDTIPSELPRAPAAGGLTRSQRRRRAVSRALAEDGFVEVLPFPFVSGQTWDTFGLAADDPRRRTVSLLNPLDTAAAELASTLLPGMLEALRRNYARGNRDVALFTVEQVIRAQPQRAEVPDVGVGGPPGEATRAALDAALPDQPVHVAIVLEGNRQHAGWWGEGEAVSWADAVQVGHRVAAACGVELTVTAAETPPWHPGRCAELRVGSTVVGHAGELHPKVLEMLELPARTCAMELDLDAIPLPEESIAPAVSPYPPVRLDVALAVGEDVPAAEVAAALRSGAGELLEELWLFDVYSGSQLGEGNHSLAYSMRFRAPDRTLTDEEATAARDAAVAAAAEQVGAALRG